MKGTVGGTLDVDATSRTSRAASRRTASRRTRRRRSNRRRSAASRSRGRSRRRLSRLDRRHPHARARRPRRQRSGERHARAQRDRPVEPEGPRRQPSLEEIGKLFDQPLSGIGKVDATVTGNRRELQAVGNVTGNGVKYGENGALTMSSDFTAKVPDLTVADAHVAANTQATFVTVAGQNINELDAKTTYAQKQRRVRRDRQAAAAVARRGRRAGAASGSSGSAPAAARLETQGLTWQMAPGSEATIKYGDDTVAVQDLDAGERRSADRRRRRRSAVRATR